MDDEICALKVSVERQCSGAATLMDSVHVEEVFQGQPVWEGTVHVFDLESHPTTTRAYAWSSPIEGSTKRRFFAVLHTEAIRSPLDAVRAAIVAEHRSTFGSVRGSGGNSAPMRVRAGVVIGLAV